MQLCDILYSYVTDCMNMWQSAQLYDSMYNYVIAYTIMQ